ncbi:MAG: M91 family zinc metallopeptidase [Dermatophilaceae bacterium]
MARGVWDLDERIVQLEQASTTWAEVSTGLAGVSDSVASRSDQLLGEWEGCGATSYDGHRSRLVDSLDRASALAADAAATVDDMAGLVREARALLDRQWMVVSRFPMKELPDGSVTIYIRTAMQRSVLRDASEAAIQTRTELDAQLSTHRRALQSAAAEWRGIAETWRPVTDGVRNGFRAPLDGGDTGLLVVDGKAIVNPGRAHSVTVGRDPETGQRLVHVVKGLGKVDHYRIPSGADPVIRGAQRSSNVIVHGAGAVTFVGNDETVEFVGGSGNDRVVGLGGRDLLDGGGGQDMISGGSGPDYLDGQRGTDRLTGGSGHDSIYGGPGDDTLRGEDGSDHHEGGHGDDDVSGGRGGDVLSGGRDDDTLLGGEQDDAAYGGFGADRIHGGQGEGDSVYDGARTTTSGSENVHRVIPTDPRSVFEFDAHGPDTTDYRERVGDDLLFLGSSPTGRGMLDEVERVKNLEGIDVSVRHVPDIEGSSVEKVSSDHISISYSVSAPENDSSRPSSPPAVLFHEMNHVRAYGLDRIPNSIQSEDNYQGNDSVDFGQGNVERWAVGLPVDHDNDPSTPEELDPGNPRRLTENGLLLEFGWPERRHYNE